MTQEENHLIDVLETAHSKLSKLEIQSQEEFFKLLVVVVGYNMQNISKRCFDPGFNDDPDITFIDFVSPNIDLSKSDIRKLIKGGGIKVNNKIPDMSVKVKDLQWIEIDDGFKFCIIKIGKNKFDFIFM